MIKPVAEHAEKEGVLLLVEPEPGLLIETCEQAEEFMSHMTSPAVGLNFDIGHQYCVGEDPAASVKRLAKWVRHVHLEDIAATRVHHHLIPGEGAIDFASVLKAIREIGYDGLGDDRAVSVHGRPGPRERMHGSFAHARLCAAHTDEDAG